MKNKIYLLLFISTVISLNAFAQPANNNCASATVLTVNAPPLCGQTTVASYIQGGESINQCGASGIDQSVWYSFTATQSNMDAWVDNLVSGGCYMGSVVYNSSACLPIVASIISCKPNTGTGGIDYWHHLTGLTVGNIYLIQIVYNAGGPCNSGQTFCISVIAPPTTAGYTQPTTGMAGENIGACMTTTCAGQFYDDGGAGLNYSNSINQVYRTFCPDAAGQCMQANINYIDLEQSFDGLTVLNGPTQNSPAIAPCNPCYKTGNITLTSTDASGCLGFRFNSDNTINYPGWNITFSCVPCAANTTADNNDCTEATQICGNTSFTGASAGPGIVSDGCTGCNTSEHFTNWYKFCATSTGTLQFLIDPVVNTQDYDFALYGPGVTCGTLGVPIRCSYAAGSGNTGLLPTALDNSEDVSGNGWVDTLNITTGQCFFLMVSQWSAGGSGFSVDFTGSTASLSCTLPIELLSFTAYYKEAKVITSWTTASEQNNDYFTVERSADGATFEEIGKVKGAGSSSTFGSYEFVDPELPTAVTTLYYRLKQTDFDGKFEYSKLVAITIKNNNETFMVYPNPAGNNAEISFNADMTDNAVLNVMDITGRLVASKKINQQKGMNSVQLDTGNYTKGIYFITLTNKYEVLKTKFVKE